jgi:hypothetical protein
MGKMHELKAWRSVLRAATDYVRRLEDVGGPNVSAYLDDLELAQAEQRLERAAWKWAEERRLVLEAAADAALAKHLRPRRRR